MNKNAVRNGLVMTFWKVLTSEETQNSAEYPMKIVQVSYEI